MRVAMVALPTMHATIYTASCNEPKDLKRELHHILFPLKAIMVLLLFPASHSYVGHWTESNHDYVPDPGSANGINTGPTAMIE